MTYISALLSENRKYVKVWERNENGERVCKKYDAPFYFYVEDEDGEFEDLYDGKKLSRLDYDSARDFFDARKKFEEKKLKLYESDIPPEYKILAEHYFNSNIGKLHVTFYDIEVDYDKDKGFSSPTNPYAPINSIALYHEYSDRTVVLVVPPKTRKGYTHGDLPDDIKEGAEVIVCKDEKELLKIFFEEIEDTDIISGWNSDMFDNPYVYERAKLIFGEKFANRICFDESREPYYREIEIYGNINKKLCIHGRVSLDYIDVYKKFEMSEKPSYALEAVSEDELPHLPKLSYTGSLYDLYRNDFEEFIRYNIRDTLILKGLEQKKRYIKLAIQMSHSATSKIEDVLGTTKVAEMSVLNYCHYNLGKIIPDYKPPEGLSGDKYEGAIVLPPNVGMHEWIASLDIASLYPSTMRSLNISPETITGQFIEGADAYKEIFEESDKDISFKEEKSGKFYTAPAKKWKTFLKKNNWTVSGCGTTFHQDYDGVIPSVLTQWFTERKEYKKKMFEASQRGDKEAQEYYDNMQYIKKIQLNSMYGATGNKYFKFYDVRLAKSTTLSGREILMHMVKKVAEKLNGNYEWPSKSIYYGDSVAHDTKIYIAPNHDVKISELFTSVDDSIGDREYCYPKNVNVLTYSESKNKTVFRPIKYVMRHKCNKKMYRVHLNNYQYVDVTEDHSLIGYKNTKQRKKNESHLVELKPTEFGNSINSLVYLQNIPRESDDIESLNYSKEVYEFLGYVIGDGYCGPIAENGQHAGVGLSIGTQDINEVETKLLSPLKNQGLVTSWHVKPNGHDVRICGTAIARLVRQSVYAEGGKKSIPSWMHKESRENICSFLRGYFSADGTLTKGMPVLCSTNSEYLEEVQKLLFLCGISSTICQENRVNSYNGVSSGTYTKRLAVKQRDIFAERIGFILDRKQNKINTKTGRYFSYQSKFDFAIQQIQKVEEIEYSDYVYDIEVEDTHTFFANNVLVHNTDSVYFYTRANSKEKSRLIANKLCDIVNKSYPGFMRDAFNCDDNHDKLIKAEQEIVSDRGIFIKKKYYILHLVSKDGKDVDEMKNMGVPIKKTTLPKEIKIELESYIERLLKGESWDIIGPEIVAYKDKIKNLDNPLVLGLPTGVKKVEHYTELFNSNDPNLKSLPGHVAASILWNKSLNVYGDKESPKIISGSKIKVFYLKNKIDRFKSIAVPKELSEPPEWFLKHFEPIIDKDAQITRLVDNPMKIMISAAGLKVPTKKKILFEKVFE